MKPHLHRRLEADRASVAGRAGNALSAGGVVEVLSTGVADVFHKIAPTGGKALLFGSRARGDARQDSDWDVLILLDKDRITPTDLNEVGYPIRKLGWDIDAQFNPIIYTMKDWEARSFTPFYKNVMKEGVAL